MVMKAIKEPKGPVIELVNAPKKGTLMRRQFMWHLMRFAEMNKAKRLLIVFER